MMTWKDVWKPPYKYDMWGWIWAKDDVPVFTFECPESEEEDKQNSIMGKEFAKALNNEDHIKYKDLEIRDGCDLYQREKLIGSFRGWGHLTGGLDLSCEEAAKIQDELVEEFMRSMKQEGN